MVTYVWRRPSSPPRPHHDFAWPSLNMDLSKVKVGCDSEAGGGADVAAHSGPIEEQPAT